jgi:hypothetical protein
MDAPGGTLLNRGDGKATVHCSTWRYIETEYANVEPGFVTIGTCDGDHDGAWGGRGNELDMPAKKAAAFVKAVLEDGAATAVLPIGVRVYPRYDKDIERYPDWRVLAARTVGGEIVFTAGPDGSPVGRGVPGLQFSASIETVKALADDIARTMRRR